MWYVGGDNILSEKCLECKHCEIITDGCNGKLGETIFGCNICEEDEKDCSFESK